MNNPRLLSAIVSAVFIAVFATTAVAAPLPAGTKLLIQQGVGSDVNTPCSEGSCFSMEVNPGIVIWTDFAPGTDGGIVVGKSQLSGGQEIDKDSTLPGELSSAWSFFGANGTFFTTPDGDTLNIFDDASCTGAGCIGKTELKVFNLAWNGTIIPLGSKDGCNDPSCTPDQMNGIFVSDYQTDLVNKTWSLVFNSVAPMGQLIGITF
jgi:hypothetical protein